MVCFDAFDDVETGIWKFILAYFFYFLAAVHQSMALSALFSDVKLGSEVSTFITTLTTLLSYLCFVNKVREYDIFFYGLSIFPQPCLAFG